MMNDNQSAVLRDRLVSAMEGNESHIKFESALSDFPPELRSAKPDGAPHSAWELLEHLRITQRDILEFSRDPDAYKELEWPDDYWPKSSAPPDESAWNSSIDAFKADRKELDALIQDANQDLFKPFPHGTGQTLLREALLLANHNSYHLGQLMFLKKMLTA
jgi:hypothetical protein